MRVKFILQQGQEAWASGNGHKRTAVVSADSTHFCRQVQLSPAHVPRTCEINLPILWSTWKPFICMATCLTKQQYRGAGSTSSDLWACTFMLLLFLADHWPGAQAELTRLPGKSFVNTFRKTHSGRYLVICLSFTKLGHIFATVLKGLQKVLLSHDWTLHMSTSVQK